MRRNGAGTGKIEDTMAAEVAVEVPEEYQVAGGFWTDLGKVVRGGATQVGATATAVTRAVVAGEAESAVIEVATVRAVAAATAAAAVVAAAAVAAVAAAARAVEPSLEKPPLKTPAAVRQYPQARNGAPILLPGLLPALPAGIRQKNNLVPLQASRMCVSHQFRIEGRTRQRHRGPFKRSLVIVARRSFLC
ncbi:hypothetical protein CLOP_g19198 [Closterium sp. NIES-67]|nr:hypothetical protein CLOP_g19198 [Closterium sp. NIES-67]